MYDSYLSDMLAQSERAHDDDVQMVEKFLDIYDVTFELRAINSDGEIIAKISSSESADSVANMAWQIDNAIYEKARAEQIEREDPYNEPDFSGATEGDR